MMNTGIYASVIAAGYQNQRIMQEQRRRRIRQEEERKSRQRQEEEKRQKESIVKHKKCSSVVLNNEYWQKERCLKAFSMQPSVQKLVKLIKEERLETIRVKEQKVDQEIINNGYLYEDIRKKLGDIIDSLGKSGVIIEGTHYMFSKIKLNETSIEKPIQTTESFGNIFIKDNGEAIEITPSILSRGDYYESRYQELNPIELEKEFKKAESKLKVYKKYGKYLGFLLKTKRYLDLEGQAKDLSIQHTDSEQRKREMEAYQSLSLEQLSMIKEYFQKLDELYEISKRINRLFCQRFDLRTEVNESIYSDYIKAVVAKEENNDIVKTIQEYISKLEANDEETMKEAYELVKGRHPIYISNKMIINKIFVYLRGYKKENPKEKKYS